MLVEILQRMWEKMKIRMKKKMKESSVILPQEMLVDILLRLPVKSLARFKCMSKLWLSLISDPFFARSHYDRALAPTHRILLSMHGALEIPSIDFNAPSLRDYTTKLLRPPIPHIYNDYDGEISGPVTLGSCRGFILIRFLEDLYIWNPCTGVQRRIPSPAIPGHKFLYGFGYDSLTDDYLVTLGSNEEKGAKINVFVAIFSMKNNIWKQFDGFIPEFFKSKFCHINSYAGGLFFNGANHWIAHRAKVLEDVIVAFDLTERFFFEIALPKNFLGIPSFEYGLHVIGGFLSVYPGIWFARDKIWVMEEYKVQSSWRCLVHLYTSSLRLGLWKPIYITVGDGIVGLNEKLRYLVKYNYEGEVLERRDFPHPHTGRCVAVMHTHSLLSLP